MVPNLSVFSTPQTAVRLRPPIGRNAAQTAVRLRPPIGRNAPNLVIKTTNVQKHWYQE